MIKRNVQLIFFFSVSWLTLFAQQDPQFSQYLYSQLFYNPAFAGSEGGINSTLILRNQWRGFSGNPLTGVVSIDAPINKINSGIGGVVAYDQVGGERTFFGKTSYSYKIKIQKGILSLGVDAGIINKTIVFWEECGTGVANPTTKSMKTYYDNSTGIFYQTNKFYSGLSSTHLTQPKLKKGNFSYRVARHYYFTSGYKIFITESMSLQPSVLIKSDAASTQLDLNATIFHKYFLLGAGYRIQDAVVLIAGFNMKGFSINYSYDYTTSILKNYSSGSHEIVLRYILLKKKSPPAQL